MKTRGLVAALVAACALMGTARAELAVQVSIEISGPIEEILPLLTQLEALGIRSAAESSGGLQFSVDSTIPATPETAGAAGAPGQDTPAAGATVIQAVSATPAQPKRGQELLVAVDLVDPARNVDTMAVRLELPGDTAEAAWPAFDLYDNGSHGDAVAGDGRWTGPLALPHSLVPGSYRVVVTPFDRNGAPLPLPGSPTPGAVLEAVTTIAVVAE